MKNFALLLLITVLTLASQAQDRVSGKAFATRSEVIAQNGMAATSQPLATQAALDILKKGGSAMPAVSAVTSSPLSGTLTHSSSMGSMVAEGRQPS